MEIEVQKGWLFFSADFSVQSTSNPLSHGNVMLIRSIEDQERWHNMPDELKESDEGPELYVVGRGRTIEAAIDHANIVALSTKPIPPNQRGGH